MRAEAAEEPETRDQHERGKNVQSPVNLASGELRETPPEAAIAAAAADRRAQADAERHHTKRCKLVDEQLHSAGHTLADRCLHGVIDAKEHRDRHNVESRAG